MYRDPTRRQRVETFPTHADAKRRKAEIETDLHRGVWRDPDSGKAKFEEVWFAYLNQKQGHAWHIIHPRAMIPRPLARRRRPRDP